MSTPAVIDNFINGQWRPTTDRFPVVDPRDQKVIALVANSTEVDVDAAVRAAREAFGPWRDVTCATRAQQLHAIGNIVGQRIPHLAGLITTEMGKTIGESTGEVEKLAAAFHFYAEEATRAFGSIIPNDVDRFSSLVVHEPIGVVGAITPWNYPLELVGWKLCASLAAGCTIVVKPSEFSTLSVAALFECLADAGLPPGVANLVYGQRHAGPLLVNHQQIDKIAFTGSSATGDIIAKSIPRAKPLSMELGGNCPMIVTSQANIPTAIKGALRRGFRNAGQICIAINRIYVHDDLYDAFVDGLTEGVAKLQTGDGMDPSVDVGPLATQAGLAVVEQHVSDARSKGARITTGGYRIEELLPGNYYKPTVIADCSQDMLVMHDESFGPVVGIMRYQTLEDAITYANGTDAGLAAYVFTENLHEAFELGHRLDFGNVAVNNVDPGTMNAPYGGRKGSGYGYEHGADGLASYLLKKHIRVNFGI
jgi:succinate-semialdehyde dehydrogenase/glutarate-semialdehyde dehydrogenase